MLSLTFAAKSNFERIAVLNLTPTQTVGELLS